jgi:hypothetical protein
MTSSYKDCPQSDGLQLETARSPLAHLLKKEPGFMRLWNGIDETGRVEIRETGCCQSHRIKAPTSPEPAKNRQSVRMRRDFQTIDQRNPRPHPDATGSARAV